MIGTQLAAVLSARRADFNQRFKLAQQQYRALDAEAWFAFVRDTLDPVAEIVGAHDASAVPAVIDVLYDQCLPLVAQRWLGREPRELAPALVRDPARLSGALLNALYQLCAGSAQRAQVWTQRLAAVAGKVADVDTVLALGRVLAWRTGLPAYREEALRVAPQLPPELIQQALGLETRPDAALWAALAQAPALRADEVGAKRKAELEWLGWCGGFRGLGGPFAALPVVGLSGGRLAASDGQNTWWVAADGYGAQTVRMGPAKDWPLDARTAAAAMVVKVSADGAVTAGQLSRKFAELETAHAAVSHGGIVAVALRTSYQVGLLRCIV
jgi:hypothetical protein